MVFVGGENAKTIIVRLRWSVFTIFKSLALNVIAIKIVEN